MATFSEPEDMIMDIASQSVHDYGASESQVGNSQPEHDETKECWACEDHLTRGIKSFEAMSNAEQLLFTGESQGKLTFTREMQAALLELYECWLTTAEKAEVWITSLIKRNRAPENLARFQEVAGLVRISITTRKRRQQEILSVNNAKLISLAATHKPPAQWFDEADC